MLIAFKCHYCGRLLVKDSKDVYLRPYFGPERLATIRLCENCRKIFDERSEKENNDLFGMVNK